MIYLLDTDIIVFLIRGFRFAQPKTPWQKEVFEIRSRILSHCRERQGAGHSLGISALTAAELELGARLSGDYDFEHNAVVKVLAPFQKFAFDADSAPEKYGIVQSELKNLGLTIGPMDTLIAAHALALEATLVTNNLAEYSRVPGLKVENWST